MVDDQSPAAAPGLKWGIIGAGFIAGKFTNAVREHTQSRVVAIGSRDKAKAEQFAAANGIDGIRIGYHALVEDPEVDAVYIATPHPMHRDNALMAIAAGKHVLVEKPFACTEDEGQDIANAAQAAGVFAMEAMWTLFLPHIIALRRLIEKGEVGHIVHVHAEHGQRFAFNPEHRLYNRALGGGALLDLGVYPVSFIQHLLGEPSRVLALGQMTETDVDGQVSMLLDYGARTQASCYTTLWARSPIAATVTATSGRVEVRGPFIRPTSFLVTRDDETSSEFTADVRNGFQYEIAEAARCIRSGALESPTLPVEATLGVLRTMDEVRRQMVITYPIRRTT